MFCGNIICLPRAIGQLTLVIASWNQWSLIRYILVLLSDWSRGCWRAGFIYVDSWIAAEIVGSNFYCEKMIFHYFQSTNPGFIWHEKLGLFPHDDRCISHSSNAVASSSSWKDSFHLHVFDSSETVQMANRTKGVLGVWRQQFTEPIRTDSQYSHFCFSLPCTSAASFPPWREPFETNRPILRCLNPAYWNRDQISDWTFLYA